MCLAFSLSANAAAEERQKKVPGKRSKSSEPTKVRQALHQRVICFNSRLGCRSDRLLRPSLVEYLECRIKVLTGDGITCEAISRREKHLGWFRVYLCLQLLPTL
jgi:hypothetical protein